MRRSSLLLMLLFATAGSAHAQESRDSLPRAAELERAAWLAGCWEGTAGSFAVEEHWLPLRAGTLVSAARSTRDGRTASLELAVIRMRGDTLAYHAYPVGQAAAVFPAESAGDSALVFANPHHDFPQRIVYRRAGADSLVARIEGPGRDGWQAFDYRMRRVTCPAAGADR